MTYTILSYSPIRINFIIYGNVDYAEAYNALIRRKKYTFEKMHNNEHYLYPLTLLTII